MIYICHKERIPLYNIGINSRLDKLMRDEYLLNNISLPEDCIVFDIGSNIGEFGVYLRANCKKMNIEYHAFEPSMIEYETNKLNNNRNNDFINNVGLWNKKGVIEFYNKNITGDSSFIETDGYTSIERANVDTIDNYVKKYDIQNIRLLKLEAEGGEPEVLEGAINTLPIIDYITADLGYERGINEEHTFSDVTNFLLSNGYEIIDINLDRFSSLYKNKKD